MQITRPLARFVVGHDYATIPHDVRHEAARSLVNWLGCALGGATHPAVESAIGALADYTQLPQATVIGRRERVDTLHAALLNGIASHVFDFDDTHLTTLLHASVAVAPALLALSERQTMTGSDFITAFVLGVEIEARIANAIYAGHNKDWYITGTAGPIGAAAAAGKILGLDEDAMVRALGIAAVEGAGLRQMAGTMSKAFVHGRAAQNGLYAALLAQRGFTSSEEALEGPRGFLKVVGGATDFSAVVKNLGKSYELSLNTYKPYACGVVAHPVIDGCLALREQHGLSPDRIQRVILAVSPQALELAGSRTLTSALESKWSIYHSAAAAIARGAAGEHEYSDDCVFDGAIAALRARVEAAADASLAPHAARVKIELEGGHTLEHHVEHASGSIENPMTDHQLSAKFRGLAAAVLAPEQIGPALALCWSLENLADVSAVVRASVPA